MDLFDMAKHLLFISIIVYFIYRVHYLFFFKYTYFNIGFVVVFLFCVEYYNYKFHKSLFNSALEKKEFKELWNKEEEFITNFLNTDLDYFTSKEIEEFSGKMLVRKFSTNIKEQYADQISKKENQATKLYKKLVYEENIEELKQEQQQMNDEINDLKLEKRRLENGEEDELEEIKDEMNLDEETLFYKEDISEQQSKILKNEGFRQSNEYSIFSKENETVLVKPIMNNSNTHIFLSYEIKELLENLEMQNIKEHLTIDADITFKHKNKIYAIEVETGSLLKKKKQLSEKINYLNNKYRNRWLFVVSNKNLLTEYKKYGFSTQRSQVEKTLKKWLKIDTQQS